MVESEAPQRIGPRIPPVGQDVTQPTPRFDELRLLDERPGARGDAPDRRHGVHEVVLEAEGQPATLLQLGDEEVGVAPIVVAIAPRVLIDVGVDQGMLGPVGVHAGEALEGDRLVSPQPELPEQREAALLDLHVVGLDHVEAAVVVEARLDLDQGPHHVGAAGSPGGEDEEQREQVAHREPIMAALPGLRLHRFRACADSHRSCLGPIAL